MSRAIHKLKNTSAHESKERSRSKSSEPDSRSINAPQAAPRNTGNRAIRHMLAGPVNNGLPDNLKAGIENLSGVAMSDVRVHYNSSKPEKLNALAHTQGSNIYLSSGQEAHLPHEAWHVVQQRQGRVKPTNRLRNGTVLNNDPVLDQEADRMGDLAAQRSGSGHERKALRHAYPPASAVVQRKKKAETGFGHFETTTFDDADDAMGKGVNIELSFKPDKKKVNAEKIALVQSLKTTAPSGATVFLGVSKKNRMVPTGKSGAGYAIDAPVTTNNPIYYDTKNLGPSEELKDTPMLPTHPDPTMVLLNPNYELGFCYKQNPKDKDKDKKVQPAKLLDKPRTHKKGESQTFETAALAIDGKDKNTYYGSVKWGYKLEEKDGTLKVKSDDISLASAAKGKQVGVPTENFLEPAKLWNAAEVQGTLQVVADVRLKERGKSNIVTLTKGTKVKQIAAGVGGETPAFVAEVLSGPSIGIIVNIRNSDVEDVGSGLANKQLPIP